MSEVYKLRKVKGNIHVLIWFNTVDDTNLKNVIQEIIKEKFPYYIFSRILDDTNYPPELIVEARPKSMS